MADLAAKREVRRRKILENSESRLNRLLGKGQAEDEGSQSNESLIREQSSSNTFQSTTDVLQSPSDTLQSPSDTFPSSGETSNSSNNESPLLTPSAKVESRRPLSSVRDVNTSAPTSQKGEKQQQQQSTKEVQNLLQMLERVRLGACCFLALLVRWVLSSGYGLFYFQTIFLPFLMLEVGLYSFHYTFMKDVPLPSTNSLLTSALMLCGIKQDLIAVYNRIMGYATAVTEDFALYLFSFIVYNAVIT